MSSPERSPWRARARALLGAVATADAPIVAILLGFLGYALVESAWWRMRHDLPMMMYQALATNEFGLLPYRDFFDMNMPGTYATYRLIGAVFGYSDAAMRVADFTWMALLWGVTLGFLRGFPLRVPVAGLALFTLTYLRLGGGLTLQREMLVLPVVAAGLWAASRLGAMRWRALAGGLAFGLAATFKPHLAIGAVPVAVYLGVEAVRERPGERVRAVSEGLAWGVLGFAAPLGVAAAWLSWHGLWEGFFRSLGYLVYYGQLDGEHATLPAEDRAAYLAAQVLKLGTFGGGVFAGVFGAWRALSADPPPEHARRIGLLLGMGAAFALYPAGSGQFWNYHWLPLLWVASLCAALLLGPPPGPAPAFVRWLPRVVFALLVLHTADAGNMGHAFRARPLRVPADGRPDRIERFLKKHLEPGDTVQPFDWVAGGAVHGMLLAHARPATPYVYTFHFYHHVSTPYIQALRTDFLKHLTEARPAFVVVARGMWPFVRGEDTTREFPALEAWVEENYLPAWQGRNLVIWERYDHLQARGGQPVAQGVLFVDVLEGDPCGPDGRNDEEGVEEEDPTEDLLPPRG